MSGAWIERSKERPYTYKVRWRETVDGKPRKFCIGGITTAPDADIEKARIDQRLSAAAAERNAQRGPCLALSQILTKWKSARLADGAVRAPYAVEVERIWQDEFIGKQGWKTTRDITPEALDAWKASRMRPGKSHAVGISKPWIVLMSVLRFAAANLRQPIDPQVLLARRPRQMKRASPPLLTDDQVQAILARARELGDHIGAIVEHLATYGWRPVNVCRLTIGDINWRTGSVSVPAAAAKNKKGHEHIIRPEHLKLYRRLAGDRPTSASLFLRPDGQPWRVGRDDGRGGAQQLTDWYHANVSSYVSQVDPKQRGIYCLKDYAISRMHAAGIEDRTIMSFTGQSSLAALNLYKQASADRQQAAIATLPPLAKSPVGNRPAGGHLVGKSAVGGQLEGDQPQHAKTGT